MLDVDDCDRLGGFLEGLQPSVRKEVEMWEASTWEEAIEIAKRVGDGEATQHEDPRWEMGSPQVLKAVETEMVETKIEMGTKEEPTEEIKQEAKVEEFSKQEIDIE